MLSEDISMTEKILEYFKNVSGDQLRIDLEKAKYSVFKNVKSYILAPEIKWNDFTFSYETENEEIMIMAELKHYSNYRNFSSQDYDKFEYLLAA